MKWGWKPTLLLLCSPGQLCWLCIFLPLLLVVLKFSGYERGRWNLGEVEEDPGRRTFPPSNELRLVMHKKDCGPSLHCWNNVITPSSDVHTSVPLATIQLTMGNTSSSPRVDREGRATALPPPPASPPSTDTSAEACPVDHKTREIWLAQAKKNGQQIPPHPISSTKGTASPTASRNTLNPENANLHPEGESCDSSQMEQTSPLKPNSSNSPSALQTLLRATTKGPAPLATEREISTIPRAVPPEVEQAKEDARPANNEVESGRDKSGKWIYPSEQMFFDAMRRKNHDPQAADMRSIVPIHNAVNERAWGEILQWEKGKGSEA
jgi:hypothetical protein